MRAEKTVDLGNGTTVRAKELTVAEVRNLLGSEGRHVDVQAWLSGQADLPADLLGLFTDLSPGAVHALTFSEIKQIIEAVEAVNSAFFFVVEKLATLQGLLQAQISRPSTNVP